MGLELTLAWSLGLAAVWWLGGGAAPSLKTSRDLAPFVAVLGLAVIDTPAVWSGLWAVVCVAVALQPRGGGRRHSAASGWIAVGALFVIAGARADAPEAADFAALLTTLTPEHVRPDPAPAFAAASGGARRVSLPTLGVRS